MRRKPTVAGAGAKPLTWNVDEISMKVPSRRMPAAPVHKTPVRASLFFAALLAFAGMRTFIVASMVMTVFLTGCDPVGLRRICVPVPQRPNDSATIEIHRPDVQEVLRVLDAVVEPLGFKASSEPTTNDSIRVYWLNRQPATVEGRSYSRNVPIRVIHTPKGIEVAFGHFGFLGGTPEPAVRAFKDARAALVSRYGSKNVKTKTFGGVAQTGADHSR